MRVLLVGVGDAFTRCHFGTSALLDAPGGAVLIDCPDLVHRALHEATSAAGWTVDVTGIDDIILTHLHGDHCNGLESFGFARRLAVEPGARVRPRLHTAPAVAARLWERLAPAMDGTADAPRQLADFFELHELVPGTSASIAGLEVECRTTRHPIPTIGLLVRGPTGTLGWSGDTPFERAHVEWLDEADLIVHESNLGVAHTAIAELNGLPPRVRSKMRLVHVPDDFDPACTDIPVLAEGDVLEV